MIKVKHIQKVKNDSYIITIENNGKDNIHIVTENVLVKHRLLVDKELNKNELKAILKENDYEELYLKAVKFISYKMRTISEVKKHLRKSTKSESVIQKIVNELKDRNYLNDQYYAKEYTLEKMNYDLVGPLYIREKLIQKGIHYDLIEENLKRYTFELEETKILELIEKELKYPFKKNYQKVIVSIKQRYTAKGFHLSAIDAAITIMKDSIIENINTDSLIKNDIMKLRKDYDLNDYSQKQMVIDKLRQKGYHYNTIKKHID